MNAPRTEAEAVVQFRPFVVKTARYFRSSSVTEEDLIQEGLIAVALAFRQWRDGGGANFLTWIRRPVYFAMLKIIQEQNRAGFRGAGRKWRGIEAIFSMDSTPEDFGLGRARPGDEANMSNHDTIGTFDEPPDTFALERLPDLIGRLDERERKVIRLRFEGGLTYKQTGARMKVSSGLVRLLERQALAKLKAMMADGEEDS